MRAESRDTLIAAVIVIPLALSYGLIGHLFFAELGHIGYMVAGVAVAGMTMIPITWLVRRGKQRKAAMRDV